MNTYLVFDAWSFWKIWFWQMSVFHIGSLGHSNREIVARLVPFPSVLCSWLTSFRIRQWEEKLLEHCWKPSSKVIIMPLLSLGSLICLFTFGSYGYSSYCLKPHWNFSVLGILQNQYHYLVDLNLSEIVLLVLEPVKVVLHKIRFGLLVLLSLWRTAMFNT